MANNSAGGGVLLDTSFFLHFLKPQAPLQQHADRYFRYFLQHNWPMYLSTVVIAEYCVKGQLDELPLLNLRLLPFTVPHAVRAGELRARVIGADRLLIVPDVERTQIPNDTKLFAQADQEHTITHYLSADDKSRKVFNLLDQAPPRPRFQFVSLATPPEATFSQLFI